MEGAILACDALLEDLNNIRNVVRWTWMRHWDRRLDLTATAVVRNTSTGIANDMAADVTTLFDSQRGIWEVLSQVYLRNCLPQGFERESITLDLQSTLNCDTYGITDSTFVGAYRLIETFALYTRWDRHRLYVFRAQWQGS